MLREIQSSHPTVATRPAATSDTDVGGAEAIMDARPASAGLLKAGDMDTELRHVAASGDGPSALGKGLWAWPPMPIMVTQGQHVVAA